MRAPSLDLRVMFRISRTDEKTRRITNQVSHLFREFEELTRVNTRVLPTFTRPHYLCVEVWISVLDKEEALKLVLRLIQHTRDSSVVYFVRILRCFGINSRCERSRIPGVCRHCRRG